MNGVYCQRANDFSVHCAKHGLVVLTWRPNQATLLDQYADIAHIQKHLLEQMERRRHNNAEARDLIGSLKMGLVSMQEIFEKACEFDCYEVAMEVCELASAAGEVQVRPLLAQTHRVFLQRVASSLWLGHKVASVPATRVSRGCAMSAADAGSDKNNDGACAGRAGGVHEPVGRGEQAVEADAAAGVARRGGGRLAPLARGRRERLAPRRELCM